MKDRIYFMDNLRLVIVLTVIVFHVAIGYMSPPVPWWYVNDSQSSPLFNLFVMVADVYIMPVMFLLAGYFALPALQKRGTAAFWKDKAWRIVLPWLGGVLVLAPAITYMIWYSRPGTPPPYGVFYTGMFWGAEVFNHAHYWFLGELTYFFAVLTWCHTCWPQLFQQEKVPVKPGALLFVGMGLVCAIGFFIPNLAVHADLWYNKLYLIALQPTRIVTYLCYFALGVYAWKKLWFTPGGYRPRAGRWSCLALTLVAVFMVYRVVFSGSSTAVIKAGHALLHAYMCLAVVIALLAVFQKYGSSRAYLWRRGAANSYIMYYIHQAVVLPLAYSVQQLAWPVYVKYTAVAVGSVVLSFIAAEYVVGKLLAVINGSNKAEMKADGV